MPGAPQEQDHLPTTSAGHVIVDSLAKHGVRRVHVVPANAFLTFLTVSTSPSLKPLSAATRAEPHTWLKPTIEGGAGGR